MTATARVSTGLAGLDEVLGGGLLAERAYLVRGRPGTGKTILGWHFLAAGVEAGETVLYVNLEEPADGIRENAATFGIDLDGVEFLELVPDAEAFLEEASYDVFEPHEVEQPLVDAIQERVEALAPDRILVDPMSTLRYIAPSTYQFRRQALSFMRYVRESGATVLLTSQDAPSMPDDDLQYLADGVVELADVDGRRTVSVPKMRGTGVRGGRHALRIDDAGLAVFPRVPTVGHRSVVGADTVSSGVDELDALLGGGLEQGTVTILSGPTGVGKTTLGGQFAKEAAARDERSVIYLFEESYQTFRHRSEAIGTPVDEMEARGTLVVEAVEPLALSPEEFAHRVMTEVDERGASLVMIDGIEGYRLSVQGEDDRLTHRLHALLRYLKARGVTVILVDVTGAITGDFSVTSEGVSYLADNVVFLRYLEIDGELRKVVGVLKKRLTDFENQLREFRITPDGIVLGDPLTGLRGALTGTPEFVTPPPERPANDE